MTQAWKTKDYISTSLKQFSSDWNRFFFTPVNCTTLAVIRICTGLLLLFSYGSCSDEVLDYVGPAGWVDQSAISQIRGTIPQPGALTSEQPSSYGQSLWYYIQNPDLIRLLHYYFVACIVCFTLGLFSRLMNLLVWIGHLSFVHRSMVTWYGVDIILAVLLFYLLIAPTGRVLSLDRAILDSWRKNGRGPKLRDFSDKSWTANLSIRLIQIHVCVIYLCSGLAKLQGKSWWNGGAIWHVLMARELNPYDLRWLASLGDTAVQIICMCGVALTLGYEISFAFLIWNRRLRPILLAMAVIFHGFIGVLMGLTAFSLAMLTGCLAFVDPEAIQRFVQRIRLRPREPEVDLELPSSFPQIAS
jgi:vitamin K-dependent gamma-carboxylase-like protein